MFCVFACIYLCMEICEPLKLFLFTFPMGSEFFFFRPLSLGLVPAFLRRFFLVVFFLHSSSLVKVWNVSHAFYFPVCCFCCCFAYFFSLSSLSMLLLLIAVGSLAGWLNHLILFLRIAHSVLFHIRFIYSLLCLLYFRWCWAGTYHANFRPST